MLENKWLVGIAWVVGLAGCVGTAEGDDESASSSDGDTDGPGGSSETVGGDPTVGDGVESVVSCSEPAALAVSDAELATNGRADAAVGARLFGALSGASDNVLLSPLSLRTAFGQVYAGTSGAARTEIEGVFELGALGDRSHDVIGGVLQALETRNTPGDEETPELVFRPANRSFFDTKFESSVNPSWMRRVQEAYGVCFEFFDLNADPDATMQHINGWVSDQTEGMIPNLVKNLPPMASLVVVNALYLRASWATPFDADLTTDRPFTTRSGEAIDVPTMRAPLMQGAYAATDAWEAVAIPYGDSRLEMVVIQPSVAETFEQALDADALEGVFDALDPAIVDLSLPKFDISSTWALREPLRGLGMTAAFGNKDDFAGIAEGMLPIWEVFHDVAIAIDEKGTEASAATGIVFGGDGGEDPVAEYAVTIDRTFYLAIRDRQARSVLFFARVGDPSASS